jgi:hypothetical protein
MRKEDLEHLEIKRLKEQLFSLEKRINRLEESVTQIGNQNTSDTISKGEQSESDFEFSFPFKPQNSIEFGMGEYGMAWLGNIVLLIAITFFVQYLHKLGNPILSILVGYAAVAGIYAISFFARNAYIYLSNLFRYNGHLLLFYLTIRLHFVENPVLKNQALGLVALLVVTGILLYLSYRKESQLLTGIVMLMMLISGLLSNSTHFLLGISSLAALLSIFLYYRFGWIKLVIAFISLIYFANLLWLLNNPFITNQAQFREHHEFGFIYLIATGLIFSLLAILPKKQTISNDILIFSLIWNGLGFTTLLVLTAFTYLNKSYVLIFSLISFFSLLYAIIIQRRSFLKISASIYAIYGFITMSVAIYGIFLLPKAYTLFAIQSFLVVSMALWFRSRFIVVINTLLYLLLVILYIKDPIGYNTTNFTYMLVAFITARVINWKKDRLNLKTELLRNLYLLAGFIMTLIAFHHAMPESLITVSWIFVALLFFTLSLLLKNVKYRWLAIAAMLASAINLLFVDMSNIYIEFRILVFFILAVISITISILYTKHFIRKED